MKHLGGLIVLIAIASTPLAQDRLVIDVSKSQRRSSERVTIDYGGTGSVRNSQTRSSSEAQARRSTQGGEQRTAGGSSARRAGGSSARTTTGSSARSHSEASSRHGSVRLDTIR